MCAWYFRSSWFVMLKICCAVHESRVIPLFKAVTMRHFFGSKLANLLTVRFGTLLFFSTKVLLRWRRSRTHCWHKQLKNDSPQLFHLKISTACAANNAMYENTLNWVERHSVYLSTDWPNVNLTSQFGVFSITWLLLRVDANIYKKT